MNSKDINGYFLIKKVINKIANEVGLLVGITSENIQATKSFGWTTNDLKKSDYNNTTITTSASLGPITYTEGLNYTHDNHDCTEYYHKNPMAMPWDASDCEYTTKIQNSLSAGINYFTFASLDDESLFIGVDFSYAKAVGLHWKFGLSFDLNE